MKNDDRQIDRLFRDKLNNFEPEPPSNVWHNINHSLDDRQNNKNWFRWAAMVALIISAFGAGYIFRGFNHEPQQIANVSIMQPMDKTMISNDWCSICNKHLHNEHTQIASNSQTQDNQTTRTTKTVVRTYAHNQNTVSGGSSLQAVEQRMQEIIAYTPPQWSAIEQSVDDVKEPQLDHVALNRFLDSITYNDQNDQNNMMSDVDIVPDIDIVATNKTSPWSVSLGTSPLYALDIFDDAMLLTKQSAVSTQAFNQDQDADLGFSGGLNVNYNINKRWSVSSGAYYVSNSQATENLAVNEMTSQKPYRYFTSTQNVNILLSEQSGADLQQIIATEKLQGTSVPGFSNLKIYQPGLDLVQKFSFVEIPLSTSYKLVDKLLDVSVTAGVSANVLTNNHALIKNTDQEFWSGETPNVNKVTAKANFGIELGCDLGKSWAMSIKPMASYNINPLHDQHLVYDFPYTFGIFSGITHKF